MLAEMREKILAEELEKYKLKLKNKIEAWKVKVRAEITTELEANYARKF